MLQGLVTTLLGLVILISSPSITESWLTAWLSSAINSLIPLLIPLREISILNLDYPLTYNGTHSDILSGLVLRVRGVQPDEILTETVEIMSGGQILKPKEVKVSKDLNGLDTLIETDILIPLPTGAYKARLQTLNFNLETGVYVVINDFIHPTVNLNKNLLTIRDGSVGLLLIAERLESKNGRVEFKELTEFEKRRVLVFRSGSQKNQQFEILLPASEERDAIVITAIDRGGNATHFAIGRRSLNELHSQIGKSNQINKITSAVSHVPAQKSQTHNLGVNQDYHVRFVIPYNVNYPNASSWLTANIIPFLFDNVEDAFDMINERLAYYGYDAIPFSVSVEDMVLYPVDFNDISSVFLPFLLPGSNPINPLLATGYLPLFDDWVGDEGFKNGSNVLPILVLKHPFISSSITAATNMKRGYIVFAVEQLPNSPQIIIVLPDERVIAHEIFHTLGLGHTPNLMAFVNHLMNPILGTIPYVLSRIEAGAARARFAAAMGENNGLPYAALGIIQGFFANFISNINLGGPVCLDKLISVKSNHETEAREAGVPNSALCLNYFVSSPTKWSAEKIFPGSPEWVSIPAGTKPIPPANPRWAYVPTSGAISTYAGYTTCSCFGPYTDDSTLTILAPVGLPSADYRVPAPPVWCVTCPANLAPGGTPDPANPNIKWGWLVGHGTLPDGSVGPWLSEFSSGSDCSSITALPPAWLPYGAWQVDALKCRAPSSQIIPPPPGTGGGGGGGGGTTPPSGGGSGGGSKPPPTGCNKASPATHGTGPPPPFICIPDSNLCQDPSKPLCDHVTCTCYGLEGPPRHPPPPHQPPPVTLPLILAA